MCSGEQQKQTYPTSQMADMVQTPGLAMNGPNSVEASDKRHPISCIHRIAVTPFDDPLNSTVSLTQRPSNLMALQTRSAVTPSQRMYPTSSACLRSI